MAAKSSRTLLLYAITHAYHPVVEQLGAFHHFPHRIFQAHFAPLVTSLWPGKWHPLTLAQLETLGPAKCDG